MRFDCQQNERMRTPSRIRTPVKQRLQETNRRTRRSLGDAQRLQRLMLECKLGKDDSATKNAGRASNSPIRNKGGLSDPTTVSLFEMLLKKRNASRDVCL